MEQSKSSLNREVKGGSLFHALFAVFIVGAMLTTMMSMSLFYGKASIKREQKLRVAENLESVEQLILSDFTFSENGSWIDLFGDQTDSVLLKSRKWGTLDMVSATSKRNNFTRSRTFFVGFNKEKLEKALVLADRNQPLRLSGSTRIRGNVKLPKKGVERGYIHGSNYNGDQLIYGQISASTKQLPVLKDQIIKNNSNYLRGIWLSTDSLGILPDPGDTIHHRFDEPTLVLDNKGWLFLNDLTLTGNIIIRSDKAISVAPNASLSDVLLYAPYIELQSGFKGNIQCFASDSLHIREDVHLDYPSVVCVLDYIPENEILRLKLGERCIINGQVIVYDHEADFRKLPVLELERETTVNGEVYCNGFTEARGTINGTIQTQKFLLRTPASSYENYLKDAIIDVHELSPHFAVGQLLDETQTSKRIIKWENAK